MARRIAVAGAYHETNVFSPTPTEWNSFQRRYQGSELVDAFAGTRTVVGGFLDGAHECGLEVVPVFGAYATPSGTVTAEAYAHLSDELRRALQASGPVEAVLVELHGAMVVKGTNDPESELLDLIRNRWPDAPIACVLDLHANVRTARLTSADFLTGYRTNPHVDTYERGVAAARQLRALLDNGEEVYRAHRGVPVITAPVNQRTDSAPLRDLLELASALEREPGIRDVTVHAGYAYADIPHIGMGFSVTALQDHAEDAERIAQRLAKAAWGYRNSFGQPLLEPAGAFVEALRTPGCVAVTDTGDNINGGSPGDGTWLLHEALSHGAKTLGSLCDPLAVQRLREAGIGSEVSISLGGRMAPSSGEPLRLEAVVTYLGEGTFTNTGPMATGATVCMGATAIITCAGLDLLVQEFPTQPNDPAMFRSVGLSPEQYDVVLLKGAAAVRAGWGPLVARFVDAATPGVTDSDLGRLELRHAPANLFRAGRTSASAAPTDAARWER
jgi:microcystin degradation protein MlrC